ncbi:TonB-dependent siderophore receptor [Amorphus sp. 3PC139-8]|uniref:TonB-dependent siderophore receptor n=1 Tax=Amorphus sp. 3PC139-8 TaxID=2735676 RepID=UPI00345D5EDE
MHLKSRLRTTVAWSVVSMCLAPALAVAQSADNSAVRLSTINVEGATGTRAATAPVEGYVADVTLTGSKTATPVLEIPQSLSVITADQIEARAAENLGEALDYTAGVFSEPFGNDARFDTPYIRGFSAANSQFLNGLKIIRELGATSIEPYGMERIEVLRGPSSVLYGQGNPGGMVNLVSKRPVFEAFGEINAEAQTDDRYTGSFDVGGPVAGRSDLAYRLTGLVRNGGTQMDHVDDDRYFLAPALTWAPSAVTSLTIMANIQYDVSDSPVGLPLEYTLETTNGYRAPRSLYIGDPDFDSSDRTLASIGYEFEHTFQNELTFRQNARYLWLDWDYQNLYYSGLSASDPFVANRGSSYNTEDLGTFTMDNQLQYGFATGQLTHEVLAGLDIRAHRVDTLTEFGNAPSIDLRNPQYGQTIPGGAWYSSDVDGTLSQFGLYGQDQIRLDRWLLTLGLRHDWTRIDSTTTSGATETRQLQSDSAFSTRAGLSYEFDIGLAPYVSYATSFEPVIGNMPVALGGAPFDPSTGEQYEVGIKYEPTFFNGLFTAAAYDLKQKNVTSSEVINGVSQTVQNGEVHVQGVELSGTASLAQGLNLLVNYTYTDAEITEGDNAGNRPANVPEHMANAWLDYTVQTGKLEGLGFGGGVRFVGSRYDLDSNANLLPSNTLFDAALHYERGNFKGSLNINNITDETFVATCTSFGCYYGDGRTIIGRLTYEW